MATKKTSKRKKTSIALDDPLPVDPPILVGGGGSTYVWVRLDKGGPPVDPSSDDPGTGIKPGSKKPKNRNKFSCMRSTDTPQQVVFYDGVNPEVALNIRDANKWYVRLND